jgi:hypothetical protein
MDTTLWIIAAVVIVIALIVYRYGQKITLYLKGWGVQAKVKAQGVPQAARPPSSRNVSIGGDATNNRIVTGDAVRSTKPAIASGRNVSIGGTAHGNVIVTGDSNKNG